MILFQRGWNDDLLYGTRVKMVLQHIGITNRKVKETVTLLGNQITYYFYSTINIGIYTCVYNKRTYIYISIIYIYTHEDSRYIFWCVVLRGGHDLSEDIHEQWSDANWVCWVLYAYMYSRSGQKRLSIFFSFTFIHIFCVYTYKSSIGIYLHVYVYII